MTRFILAVAAVACSCAAQARDADPANAIAFLTPVTYEAAAGIDPALKADCDIPAAIEEDMRNAMVHQLVGGVSTTTLAGGKTLRITIANVRGTDAGGWRSAKVLSLDAALFENAKELSHGHFTSETMGPNPFKGACSTLRRVTEKLSRIIVKWARNPRNVVTPTPVDGAALPEAGPETKPEDDLPYPTKE